MSACIGVIHATGIAAPPIDTAFRKHWPDAETFQLLDESLARDLDAAGRLTPALFRRVGRLADFARQGGAEGILFSCSAFGEAIEAVQKRLALPVLKPNQAMLDEAVSAGGRIHILSTFRPSIPSMRKELEALAVRNSVEVRIGASFVEGALDALRAGDADAHNALIAEAAAARPDADVTLLAQFSMAQARERVARRLGSRVLSSPDSAVMRLRRMCHPAHGRRRATERDAAPRPAF